MTDTPTAVELTHAEEDAITLTIDTEEPTLNVAPLLREVTRIVKAREAAARREALLEAAEDLVAELVCCDVYERLAEKSTTAWTPEERQEYQHHSICYWGNASADLVRNRAALAEPERDEEGR